jgi:hypothetical protein
MSIAAAIKCTDGIVLCADSQETIGQYTKVHKPKLVDLALVSPDVKAVVVGAGDSVFMDVLLEQISIKVDLAIPNSGAIQSAIDSAVKETCADNWPLYSTQTDKPQAELLIGLRAVDGLFLFDVVTPMVRSVDPYMFIGCGCELALYKAKQIFRTPMPCEISAKLLIHVLDVVKENVEFCGGDTHVAVITANGKVDHKTPDYVTRATKGYQSFARVVDYLSPMLSVMESPDGRDFLTLMSEMPDQEPGWDKQFISVLTDLNDKKIKHPIDDPKFELAVLCHKVALAVGALHEVSTTFHDRGWITDDTHRQLQNAFGALATEGKAANEAIKGDNLEIARERLASVLSRLATASSNLLLTAQTSSDRQ